jgi:hypothetical protein
MPRAGTLVWARSRDRYGAVQPVCMMKRSAAAMTTL